MDGTDKMHDCIDLRGIDSWNRIPEIYSTLQIMPEINLPILITKSDLIKFIHSHIEKKKMKVRNKINKIRRQSFSTF